MYYPKVVYMHTSYNVLALSKLFSYAICIRQSTGFIIHLLQIEAIANSFNCLSNAWYQTIVGRVGGGEWSFPIFYPLKLSLPVDCIHN